MRACFYRYMRTFLELRKYFTMFYRLDSNMSVFIFFCTYTNLFWLFLCVFYSHLCNIHYNQKFTFDLIFSFFMRSFGFISSLWLLWVSQVSYGLVDAFLQPPSISSPLERKSCLSNQINYKKICTLDSSPDLFRAKGSFICSSTSNNNKASDREFIRNS